MDRNLLRALALSLAVHGLALSPFARPPAGGGPAPLLASLRQPAPHLPAPVPKAPPQSPVASPVRTPLPAPAVRQHEEVPVPAPVAAPVPVEAGESQAAPAVAAPASQAATAPVAAENVGAAQPAPPRIDVDGLRQYHMALGRMAARFRHYPPQARADGQEGRVPLRLTVSEAGIPVGLSLIGTSGSASLDQAALEMIGLAAGHTPVPESLRGQRFSIDLAVDYNLRDEP